VYLIVGNLCIRTGVLEGMINDKPQGDFVSWESGLTVFPGFGSFKGFTYRGQTRGSQIYVHLAKVSGRIGLIGLLSKTVNLRGVDGRDLDYRYRERIDYPCWNEESGVPFPGTPADIEFYPEIPGLQNPPDPKPEDIYSQEPEARPWTVTISDAHIKGAVRIAHNTIRIDGEGSVNGGVTVVLRESAAIDKGEVRLAPAVVMLGSRVLTEDLNLEADVRVKAYPAECAEMAEIIVGTSGNVTIAGSDSNGFSVNMDAFNPLLPGQGQISIESGTGELGGRFAIGEDGEISGQLDLVSDDVVIKRLDVPLHGDLAFQAQLNEGDLTTMRFDVSGTTFHLDDITKTGDSVEQQQKLEPWYGHLEFEEGVLTLGTPMAMASGVRLTMHDTRPVLILLRKFTNQLKWLSLTRNAKDIDGTMDLAFGEDFVAVDNLSLTGENVEILGWVHVRDGLKYGRIFARHGARSAGVAFDGSESKAVTIRSRNWFENQPRPPLNNGQER
ncbi:MAG: hypothetical protein P8127_08080, partial [Acidobacteriota bacterium]